MAILDILKDMLEDQKNLQDTPIGRERLAEMIDGHKIADEELVNQYLAMIPEEEQVLFKTQT